MAKTYPYNVKNSLFKDDIYVSWEGHNPEKIPSNSSKTFKVVSNSNPHLDIRADNANDLDNPVKISSKFEYKLKRKNDFLQIKLWAGTAQPKGTGSHAETDDDEPETTVEVGAPQ